MSTGNGRTTLAAVAAAAGVSVATVSKVLNGRHDVSPATRERVAGLLERHEYVGRRSRVSVDVAPTASATVQLVANELNAYAVELLHGVLAAATEAGVAVSVTVLEDDETPIRPPAVWSRELATSGRRAVIGLAGALENVHVAALARSGLPLVVVDPIDLPKARVASIGATNFTGGLAATHHLLGLGHRRIGYVGGPRASISSQARLAGFRAAMEAAGLPVPEAYVRYGTFHFGDGIAGGGALLDEPERPTAVFAANDETAAGVVEAARVRGLRVPEDVSVVGFDDTTLARHTAPGLTTVRQPLREIGGSALRTGLRLAAGETLESHHVEFATELVVRGSTTTPAL